MNYFSIFDPDILFKVYIDLFIADIYTNLLEQVFIIFCLRNSS